MPCGALAIPFNLMSSFEAGTEPRKPAVPSMLDLVRLSATRMFPPGGVELYRQIALLTDMAPGLEVLDVASGRGVPLEYFVREFGITASGVDIDPAMVQQAEAWTRELGAGDRLQFQTGRSNALPYRDHVFDVSIGEIGLANHCRPEDAVEELVRVTKPGGFVVLVQLVWKAPVDSARRSVLSDHLGAHPLMVVEWKRLLRESAVEDVHVEDWSDEETAFRPTVVKPFPDFTELFSLPERLSILRRAWQRWGWRGVRAAIAREREVHRLLTNERILGLDLIRGRKVGGALVEVGSSAARSEARSHVAKDGSVAASVAALPHPAEHDDTDVQEETRRRGHDDTAGLPLFGSGRDARRRNG